MKAGRGRVGPEVSLLRLFLVASSCPDQWAKPRAINYNSASVSQKHVSLFSVIQKQLFSCFIPKQELIGSLGAGTITFKGNYRTALIRKQGM